MANEASAGTGTDGARVVDEVKAAAKDVASTAKESVLGLKDQVTERATERVETRTHALADSLESLVNALHAAENALRDDNQESLATYAASLTSYVERSSGYIRNNDMNGLLTDLQKVGRENTGMFMGSTFVAGAALGRFLRASSGALGDEGTTTSGAGAGIGVTRDMGVETGMRGGSYTGSSSDVGTSYGASTTTGARTSPTDMLGDGMNDGGTR
jgi:hypothetical protein